MTADHFMFPQSGRRKTLAIHLAIDGLVATARNQG